MWAVVGVVGGLKVWPIAFHLFYGGGRQMCDNPDILKIKTSKNPHGIFLIIIKGKMTKKTRISNTNFVYRQANQNHVLCVYYNSSNKNDQCYKTFNVS